MFFSRFDSSESETALLQRAAARKDYAGLEDLTDDTLRQITRDEGVDFATTLLFERFQKSPRHAEFIGRINSLRESPPMSRSKIDARVILVPGALYRECPETGGDGRIVRQEAERLGYKTDLIPVGSFGSVVENARLIRAWFERHSKEPIIVVSLSKGGADLKTAMASPDAAQLFGTVAAWINVCGPLNGSRIADWVMANRVRAWLVRMKCFFQKRDFQFITDLCHDRNGPLVLPFAPPASMKLLNLIGFPLRRHMTTPFSRFCHRTLAAWGPNDGTTSLSDTEMWKGQVYPVWGTDHYFRPESLARSLIAALLYYLEEEMDPALLVTAHREESLNISS